MGVDGGGGYGWATKKGQVANITEQKPRWIRRSLEVILSSEYLGNQDGT